MKSWYKMSGRGARVVFPFYSTIATSMLLILAPQSIQPAIAGVTDEIVINDLAITDSAGQRIEFALKGDGLSVRSVVINNADTEVSLVYVVQVEDSVGLVVFLSSTEKKIHGEETRPMETVIPAGLTATGNYSVQALTWENVESPLTFSFTSVELKVTNESGPVIKCSGSASCINGTVTRIIDGDTIVVNDFTVRFTLVDTPERGEAGFDQATAFTANLCAPGSRVLVDEDDGQTSGSFGRMVAKVHCVGGMISEELLKSKNAIILAAYCERSEFGDEQWAREFGC